MSNLPNVGELAQSSHDERHRQRFISVLRKKVLLDFAGDMRSVYQHKVEQAFVRRHGRKPKDGREIRRAMRHEPIYEAWSSLRYNAQFMTWWSVQPAVERTLPQLIQAARDARAANPAGGSLELDPRLELPKYVTQLDPSTRCRAVFSPSTPKTTSPRVRSTTWAPTSSMAGSGRT
jgi:hypothetical protein